MYWDKTINKEGMDEIEKLLICNNYEKRAINKKLITRNEAIEFAKEIKA